MAARKFSNLWKGDSRYLPKEIGSSEKASLGRRYWRLWNSATVSAFGDNLRAAALPLLAATITHNAAIISLISITGFLPWLVFGPIGGVIGDRRERLSLMRIANLVRFLLTMTFVLLVFVRGANIAAICILTAVLTMLQIVYSSATTGYLPEILEKGKLARGNSRLESGRSLAGQFLGAPIGALLFSVDHWLPLLLDSATFAIAVFLLPAGRSARPESSGAAKRGYLHSLREGWNFMRQSKAIMSIAMLLAAVNLVTVGISAIMVLYVLQVLRAPDVVYGILTACLALGAFIGTFTTTPLIRMLGPGRLVAFAICARVVCLLVAGEAPSAWVVGIALIVQGVTMTSWNVVSTTTVQTRTPAALTGRVGTLVKTIAISAAPLGALAAGQIAGPFGLRSPFLVGAAIIAAAGLLTVPRLIPDLRGGFGGVEKRLDPDTAAPSR